METFLPSTPPPVAGPAPACGQGGPDASSNAPEPSPGLFGRILQGSVAAQSTGNGEAAEATGEAQAENSADGDSGKSDGTSPEASVSAVSLVGVSPTPATAPDAGADSSEGTPPAGDPAAQDAASSPVAQGGNGTAAEKSPGAVPVPEVAPAETAGKIAASAAADGAPKGAPPADSTPGDGKPVAAAARTALVSGRSSSGAPAVSEGTAGAASGKPAPSGAAGAGSAQAGTGEVPAAPHGAAANPAANAAGNAASNPAANAAAHAASNAAAVQETVPAAGQAMSQAAAPSKAAGSASTEGSSVEASGGPKAVHAASPSPAAQEAGPAPAPSAPDGQSSQAGGKGESESFSFAGKGDENAVDAAEPSGKRKAENTFHVKEPFDSTLPQAADGRAVAGRAIAARPTVQETAASAAKTFRIGENEFVLTRKSDTSLEVTLSPPGVGKLEIEVVLDKGIIHANITAADPSGRDAIQRSLPQIIDTLTRDGMAIGGFTVSLKQEKSQTGSTPAGKGSGNARIRPAASAPVRPAAAPAGRVDLFV